MDQDNRILFLFQVLLLLGLAASVLVGIISVLHGIVTFATVHKGFGLITFIGGLILLPIVKNALRTELKLGMTDLYLNLGAILLIIFGLVSSVEEKANQQSKQLENIAAAREL
ncbi:hypothetical protein LF296_03175 [Acinetobacter vivianii]|uniref:Uncharacterized protein n=1 Tax=Acinetobacter vivianii TaxID=1776742 RepID=A0AAJ6NK69_9GAMM|nr:hypothetical protein [Acinetobacter vivianii]WDZ51813.1 hypothetical protein LF296_03175 [Acinetobacter vivianii]